MFNAPLKLLCVLCASVPCALESTMPLPLPLPAWAVALVVVNFLFWGHWPICAKISGAPVQPFGVVMVAVQTCCALLACLCMGDHFFAALKADSQHPAAALFVFFGGAALAVGDFSAAAAIERLGVAVGGPVCFSCMLICGAVGDFLLEGSAHPGLLFGGVAGCMCAVVADSQSHPPRQPPKPADDRLRLASADSAIAVATAAGAPGETSEAKQQAERRRQGPAKEEEGDDQQQQQEGPAAVELEEGGKEGGKEGGGPPGGAVSLLTLTLTLTLTPTPTLALTLTRYTQRGKWFEL